MVKTCLPKPPRMHCLFFRQYQARRVRNLPFSPFKKEDVRYLDRFHIAINSHPLSKPGKHKWRAIDWVRRWNMLEWQPLTRILVAIFKFFDLCYKGQQHENLARCRGIQACYSNTTRCTRKILKRLPEPFLDLGPPVRAGLFEPSGPNNIHKHYLLFCNR